MTHEPRRARVQTTWSHLAVPAALALAAALPAPAGLARDSAGQGEPMPRPPAGPTTDAPSGNPLYRIAEHADLPNRVKLQILWRKPIDGLRVNVTNRGDTVFLFGQVQSESARQLAERIALRTVGVGGVDNQLQVVRPASDPGRAAPAAAVPSDAWISTRVAASLRFDRAVDGRRVHVTTADGVVTLTGSVPTAAQKGIAAEIAGDIDDVKTVDNRLVVDDST